MRILTLDVGDKRIGVAVSDDMGWTAQGLDVIKRDGFEISKIKHLLIDYETNHLVVGLPLKLNGEHSPQTDKVEEFCEQLEADIHDVQIVKWDERLTTSEAEKMLISSDVSRKNRKKVIDKLAAVLILQNYLDYLAFQKKVPLPD